MGENFAGPRGAVRLTCIPIMRSLRGFRSLILAFFSFTLPNATISVSLYIHKSMDIGIAMIKNERLNER